MISLYLLLIEDEKDRNLLEDFYNQYSNLMLHLANEIVNNKSDAEDIVHSVFLKAALNIETFSSGNIMNVKAYFLSAVRNEAKSSLRKNGKTIPLDDANENEMLTDEMTADDTVKEIADCIDKLDDVYRDTLRLAYINEMSADEIAKVFGCSRQTVYKRIERGSKLLRQLLKKVM